MARSRPWTIEWVGGLPGHVRLIDQTLLPGRLGRIRCRRVEELWEAIKVLRVRGAPAIGAAAALGVVLGVQRSKARTSGALLADVRAVSDYLATSRPTAVNLFWGLDRMRRTAERLGASPPSRIKQGLLAEAKRILEEDRRVCRAMADHGAALLQNGDTVLTHCNAGALATIDYGTALGAIFRAAEQGKRLEVFADETRPLLQGARLTAWELQRAGIPVTLICDNMAGHLLRDGKISCVVVGADRIAANGDTANKIGTFPLAVLAGVHKVPFYVAAPVSTIDFTLRSGAQIPIEERKPEEVAEPFGVRIAPRGVRVYNPAFDVTPAKWISAIVTEQGVFRPPYPRTLAALKTPQGAAGGRR